MRGHIAKKGNRYYVFVHVVVTVDGLHDRGEQGGLSHARARCSEPGLPRRRDPVA